MTGQNGAADGRIDLDLIAAMITPGSRVLDIGCGDGDLLALLDFSVIKLFHLAAVQADQMVMVLALVELVNRFATLKVVAAQDTGLFKLRQHPVHRGQADVDVFAQQMAKNIFRRHVALRAALKNVQNFQPGQCGFQTIVFQFVDLGHVKGIWVCKTGLDMKLPLQ